MTKIPVDVVFPVLHGLYGEDGTDPGNSGAGEDSLCGLRRSRFGGVYGYSFLLKSSSGSWGLRQASYVPGDEGGAGRSGRGCEPGWTQAFPYPVFVKPSNAGSSRGVTRADSREMVREGLLEAARHDRRILVEEMIVGHDNRMCCFRRRGQTGPFLRSRRDPGCGRVL